MFRSSSMHYATESIFSHTKNLATQHFKNIPEPRALLTCKHIRRSCFVKRTGYAKADQICWSLSIIYLPVLELLLGVSRRDWETSVGWIHYCLRAKCRHRAGSTGSCRTRGEQGYALFSTHVRRRPNFVLPDDCYNSIICFLILRKQIPITFDCYKCALVANIDIYGIWSGICLERVSHGVHCHWLY